MTRTTSQSGFNIFEMMWVIFIAVGAWAGGRFGWSRFGTWGVVLGTPLGAGVGFLVASGATLFLACLFKALHRGTIFAPRRTIKGNNRVALEWLTPWCSVTDHPRQAASLERELQRELPAGHSLFGLPLRALGRRQDSHDVLFSVEDGTGRVAVVHLTWAQSVLETSSAPHTEVYPSLYVWVDEAMRPDHEEYYGKPTM